MNIAHKEVFDFIAERLHVTGGVSPSFREIAAHFKCSPSRAHSSVTALVAQGWLTKLNTRHRALTIAPSRCPVCLTAHAVVTDRAA